MRKDARVSEEGLDIGGGGVSDQEKLCPCQCLVAVEVECASLQQFNPCSATYGAKLLRNLTQAVPAY